MRGLSLGRVSALALATVILTCAPALALVANLSLEDMAGQSSHIVSGRVAAIQAKWSSDHSLIVTQAVLEVDESLKGGLGRESILVEHLGGELEDIALRASGMPTLQANEQVVLFLREVDPRASLASGLKALLSQQTGDAPTYGIVGGAQGKYLLQGGSASRGGFVTSSGRAAAVTMSQDELISLIKEAVADAGAK